mgnify:CR=1 FL=1
MAQYGGSGWTIENAGEGYSGDCGEYDAIERIRGWLQRIGRGDIPFPAGEMDRANAVPVAAWLADNVRAARNEWPDERQRRLNDERNAALRRADELIRQAEALRAKHEIRSTITEETDR